MKVARIMLCGIAFSLLAACATSDEMAAGENVRIVQNDEYVAVVEELAKRRGVRVQWVNPPDRRIVASND